MMLRLRVHLVAARDGANFYAAFFRGVARDEFIERRLRNQLLFAERAGKLFDRRRLVRRVNDCFKCRFAFFVGHSLCRSGRSSDRRFTDTPDRSVSTRLFHRKRYRRTSLSSAKYRQTVFLAPSRPPATSPFRARRGTQRSSRGAKDTPQKIGSGSRSNLR